MKISNNQNGYCKLLYNQVQVCVLIDHLKLYIEEQIAVKAIPGLVQMQTKA